MPAISTIRGAAGIIFGAMTIDDLEPRTGTGTTPMFGSMVAKRIIPASAPAAVVR